MGNTVSHLTLLTNGMFMNAQLLQALQLGAESRTRQLFELLVPYSYGIKSCILNADALRNATIDFESPVLLTQQGTLLFYHCDDASSNARLPATAIAIPPDREGHSLDVHIAIPKWQLEANNVSSGTEDVWSSETNGMPRRFRTIKIERRDLFSVSDQMAPVYYLVHEVRAVVGSEPLHCQDSELIKVIELEPAEDGVGFTVSPRYIPPLLRPSASPILERMLKGAIYRLKLKAREFTEMQRQSGRHALWSRDPVRMQQMLAVAKALPRLEHLLAIDAAPLRAYEALLDLVAELHENPGDVPVHGGLVPAYDHTRLWECFNAMVQLLGDLMEKDARPPLKRLKLLWNGRYFAQDLTAQFFEGNTHYCLVVEAQHITPVALESFEVTAKVGPEEEMEKLLRGFLRGITLVPLERLPPDVQNALHGWLPQEAGRRYFLLDHGSDRWQSMIAHGNMAVACVLAPEDVAIEVWAIPALGKGNA